MKSQRQLQVGETIKRIIADIFLRDGLSSINGSYITILEADVSPDMKNVRIFIDIFGNEKTHQEIIEKLNKAAPHFRFQMAKKITARSVPEILFVLDKTQDKAIKLENLIATESKNLTSSNKKPRGKKSPKK
jgi:ribosome-binding factor A